MKKYWPIIFLISIFLLFKIGNLGVRLSDSNIYFYTGYQILQGQILYRDIFFTNLPLLPYLSAFYVLISGGDLKFFFFTPAIEASIVSLLIYLIVYKNHGVFHAVLSSTIYLFSFILLSTSDHQSGVFFASFLSVLSYYFYLNKKLMLSGVFVALSLLTKAYFIPIAFSFTALFIIERRGREFGRFVVGGVIAGLIILLPTILFAFPDFIKNVFEYSLTRSQGVGKSNVFWFFLTHDFVLFVLFASSLINIGKNKFLGLISVFGILFFIFYQDIYYLYLNFLIPFLALSVPAFYKTVQNNLNLQKGVLPTLIIPFILYSVISYLAGYRDLQKVNNYQEIVDAIKNESPKYLHGVNDITPALSYSAKIPLLNNIIDTNSNIYRKGILNAEDFTKDAVSRKTIIVTHGVYYPYQGVEEFVVDEIFDREQVKKSCKLVRSFPVKMEGSENRLNLLRCY